MFKWTPKLKREAAKNLLDRANHYKPKRRKYHRGIRYFADGRARWIGDAHDYTVNMADSY